MHPVTRFAAATLAISVLMSSPAQARTSGGAHTTTDGISTQATRQEVQQTKPTSGAPTKQPVCTYGAIADTPDAVRSTDSGEPAPLYDSTHSSTDGSWQWKTCTDATGNQKMSTVWIPKANPTALVQEAISEQSLPQPKISTSPPLPSGAVVNLPTWLWLNNADWHPVTATAAVDGFNVTAVATPVSVIWNMGDGKSVTCTGPGTAYDPTRPDASQHSDCTYAFTRSSVNQPGSAFQVTASVQWRTTWQASDGTNGQLAAITRTATIPISVREIQAVNVAPTGGW